MRLRCWPCPHRCHSHSEVPSRHRSASQSTPSPGGGPVAMSEPRWKDTAHPRIKQYTDAATGKPRYLVRYRKPSGGQTMKRGFTTKKAAEQWVVETESKKIGAETGEVTAGRVTVSDL